MGEYILGIEKEALITGTMVGAGCVGTFLIALPIICSAFVDICWEID